MSGKEPQIIQQFRAGECFGEAVAFGEQKSWAEIRATKATRILYLPVDGLMKDMSDCDFTLMKTNLVREMSNKIWRYWKAEKPDSCRAAPAQASS